MIEKAGEFLIQVLQNTVIAILISIIVFADGKEIECLEDELPLCAGDMDNVLVRKNCRYYNEEELRKGLLYELKDGAAYFIEAQNTYGIDAVFLAAVAAEESGWGRYAIKHNYFGFIDTKMDSMKDAIDHGAEILSREYLSEEGNCYFGSGVDDISICYNDRTSWREHIKEIIQEIKVRIHSEE